MPDDRFDPFEEILLFANPNPNRVGCPGRDALTAAARRRLSAGDEVYKHLTRCSPCYQELKTIRQQVSTDRRRVLVAIAATVVIVLGAALVYTLANRNQPAPPTVADGQNRPADRTPNRPPRPDQDRKLTAAVLNLESERRGDQTGLELQRLPRKPLSLSVYLPLGSDEGRYEVRLLRKRDDASPLVRSSGVAVLKDGLAVLPVVLDISNLEPGSYWLAFQPTNKSWRYRRIAIE